MTPLETTAPALAQRSFRRLVTNTLSLLTNDMVNRAITFVLYAVIARYLGAYEFGQMSLTLTLFYLLQSLAPVGLKILLVREVARDKERTLQYWSNGSLVALLSSLLALLFLLLFLWAANYSADTVRIILLVSIGLVPYSLSAVCEAIFQAHEQIRYITIANVPVSIGRGVLAFALLALGLELYWVGVLFILSYSITFVLEWLLLGRYLRRWWGPLDARFCWQISRSSLAFLGLQGVIALTGSILPVSLSWNGGVVQVGLLNAANQLMAPVLLFSQSTVMSLFPRMCQHFENGADGLRRISERLIELLLTFTLPAVVGLYFYAWPALLLLYKKETFYASVPVLQIMVASLALKAVTSVLGRVLLAAHRERALLGIMVVETLSCGLAAFVLIPSWGILGAAIATLVLAVLDTVLHVLPVWHLLRGMRLATILWKAVLASGVLAGWLWLLPGEINWLVGVFSGVCVYGAAWLALSLVQAGGWKRLKEQYRVG